MAIDKGTLADRIRSLEGLSDDERAALLGLLNEAKTYGLVWEDKPEDVEERLRTELPVLNEVKKKAILAKAPDAPNHILIEGDNLEALTALSYTHEEKVDVIYIDPPYNTGNNDFVYNDRFVDREDGYRHSKWLSFMAKRLRIAKRLLSDRGVIFISIDDNEQAQLKMLCDDTDLFGSKNFIAELVWKKKQGGGNDSNHVVVEHEYVLIYANDITKLKFNLDKSYQLDDKLYPLSDEKGEYGLITLDKASIRFSETLVFPIYDTEGNEYLPRIVNGKQACWRWGKKKVEEDYDQLVFKKGKVYTKYYRPEGVKPKSLLIDALYGRTESGHDDIVAVLGRTFFNYPKPLLLLKHILSISTYKNSTILDFFAGSGTTLHATMQLNAEDGGKRKCILVTNNENGICENVTYERNKRVIEGYTTPKGVEVAGLENNSLRYYRTAFVNRRRTPQNMRRLMMLASDMLCIKNDLYTELDEFGGLATLENGFRYFSNSEKQMLIVYDETAIYTLVDLLNDMEVSQPIITYVFSPANDPWRAEFEEVADKVCLTALPAAIYNTYKRVLPKPKDEQFKNLMEEGGAQ